MIGQHRIDLVTLCLTALRGEGLSDCVVVTINCLDKAGEKKAILLPHSLKKLHEICQKTFGFLPHEIRKEDGTQINDIKVIRDGDNLIVTSNLIAPIPYIVTSNLIAPIPVATSILPFGPSSSRCRKITPPTN
ncbi:RAC-alpha serine/threonine-protein kinase [Ancistrocladus abbreviatus]